MGYDMNIIEKQFIPEYMSTFKIKKKPGLF